MAGAGAVVAMPPGAQAADASNGIALTVTPLNDPNFVAGVVTAVDGQNVLVKDRHGVQRPLLVGSAANVWKQGELTMPLAVGDGLYARGLMNGAGVLQLQNAWVGIQNLRGLVTEQAPNQLTLRLDRSLEPAIIRAHPGGVITHSATGTTTTDTFDQISAGDHVQVIGYCSADNPGGITATRLFEPNSVTADAPGEGLVSPSPSTVATPDTECQYHYRYLTTWQCCGGVNACGSASQYGCSPPPPGTGKCYTCYTDQNSIAWPYTYYPAYGENPCAIGGGPSLPWVVCGQYITVTAVCNGSQINIPVSDCGPTPHTVNSNEGCMGWINVTFDLTACAFTALGGGLSYGHLDVDCDVLEQC